jgi:hypothetical protein
MRVSDSCFLIALALTVALDRYIVVPEDKGNELVCISAFGPTAGERVGIAHPVSTCPSSMAVDDRRCGACASSINALCLRNGAVHCSGAFVFALRQKIFVSGERSSVTRT